MINNKLIEMLFQAAGMQRWNDRIRPVELRELDKQAHKMIFAFVLGKLEETRDSPDLDWIQIIEGGLFELLQRIQLTDLKPQIYDKIMGDSRTFNRLNHWVIDRIRPVLKPIERNFDEKFAEYFLSPFQNINRLILSAAHDLATLWEFRIIERSNPDGFSIAETRDQLRKRMDRWQSNQRTRFLLPLDSSLTDFTDICGELRFQVRWSHLAMTPRTSVLGHLLIVAILSYLFSTEMGACGRRRVNNYFTGLFHDLPEVLTRDIIDPVKRSVAGLDDLIKSFEKIEMDDKIFRLLPESWHEQMRLYTESEFQNSILVNGLRVAAESDSICREYNHDRFDPRDGELVRASDHLAAFSEAAFAIRSGYQNPELKNARRFLGKAYGGRIICGVNIGAVFSSVYREMESI